MNRYRVQVTNTAGQWIDIAGNMTRQPITDAYLGGSGIARGESWRVLDTVTQAVMEHGIR